MKEKRCSTLAGEDQSFDTSVRTPESSSSEDSTGRHVETPESESVVGTQPTTGDVWKSPADSVMIREPKVSPISQNKLATEVTAIYASLFKVETKCIAIDNDLAANPDAYLDLKQNQTLLALHRTLLYEHHDFLIATQHPSSTPSIRGLTAKHSMLARLWKHGIHTYLEVLRKRRPQSQDFMIMFIYLAYQMVALLYETVPAFIDTWIGCLGDLARYRRAIEEEGEIHSIWEGIARGWYSIAVDRHPNIGWLYHHLGILERPGLLQLFLYSKSLTCVDRFSEAIGVGSKALSKLDQLTLFKSKKLKEIGVLLVVINIATIFELGTETNCLWQSFNTWISNRTVTHNTITAPDQTRDASKTSLSTTTASLSILKFSYSGFNLLIRPRKNWETCSEALPSIHCLLIWFYSLHQLRLQLENESNNQAALDWYDTLFSAERFSWATLANYLNSLVYYKPIGQQDRDPTCSILQEDDRPVPEDYKIRGLIWTQSFFPLGWFDEQIDVDEKNAENSETEKARIGRVQRLSLYLAAYTEYLDFDPGADRFSTTMKGPIVPLIPSVKVPRHRNKRNKNRQNQSLRMSNSAAAPAPSPNRTTTSGHAANMPAKGDQRLRSDALIKQAQQDHPKLKVFGENGDKSASSRHDLSSISLQSTIVTSPDFTTPLMSTVLE